MPDGSCYLGEFHKGDKEGKGLMVWGRAYRDENGGRYEYMGELKHDEICGEGVLKLQLRGGMEEIYEGVWDRGVLVEEKNVRKRWKIERKDILERVRAVRRRIAEFGECVKCEFITEEVNESEESRQGSSYDFKDDSEVRQPLGGIDELNIEIPKSVSESPLFSKSLKIRESYGPFTYLNEFSEFFNNLTLDPNLIYNNTKIYTGELSESGERNGRGIYYSNGSIYEGYWKNNKQHGLCRVIHADGAYFQGYFINGIKNGFGTSLPAPTSKKKLYRRLS